MLQALIAALSKALTPLESLVGSRPQDFAELAQRHRETLASLSADEHGVAMAFQGADGSRSHPLSTICSAGRRRIGLMVETGDYAEVFQAAFADRMVRRRELPGAQLHIFGQLEARLTETDRVILGGLVETVWPPAPRVDPWLSRPMRHELGLDLPERRIGLSAHDFAQLLGHEDVILSHSAKVGGAPAVASRFLHRLEAVAGEERWKAAKAAGDNMFFTPRRSTSLQRSEPIEQPQPQAAARDAADQAFGHRRSRTGCAIPTRSMPATFSARPARSRRHAAVGGRSRLGDPRMRSANSHRNLCHAICPTTSWACCAASANKHFAPLMERPEARALVVAALPAHRALVCRMGNRAPRRHHRDHQPRSKGEIEIALGNDRKFILSARADRIERRRDGGYAILDYKTGQPPTGETGADGTVAAAYAGGGDPA